MGARINPDEAVELFRSGQTLDVVGAQLGVTREAVRQAIHRTLEGEARPGEAYGLLRDEHDANRKSALLAAKDAAGRKERAAKPIFSRDIPRTWTDGELIQSMRDWQKEFGEPVSVSRWNNLAGADYPSVTAITVRFGSWNAAKAKANLAPSPSQRTGYTRGWTEEACVNWVAAYTATLPPDKHPTVLGYDKWARVTEGAPSVALVRSRVGRWSEVVRRALALEG